MLSRRRPTPDLATSQRHRTGGVHLPPSVGGVSVHVPETTSNNDPLHHERKVLTLTITPLAERLAFKKVYDGSAAVITLDDREVLFINERAGGSVLVEPRNRFDAPKGMTHEPHHGNARHGFILRFAPPARKRVVFDDLTDAESAFIQDLLREARKVDSSLIERMKVEEVSA